MEDSRFHVPVTDYPPFTFQVTLLLSIQHLLMSAILTASGIHQDSRFSLCLVEFKAALSYKLKAFQVAPITENEALLNQWTRNTQF